MDQFATDTVAASGGDPVEETVTAEQEAVEQQADEQTLEAEMYPDEEQFGEGDESEQEGEIEPEHPAIDAPHSWKAEDKALWGNVPREVQEIIARRETEAARAITAKSEEAKTARQTVVEQAKTEIAEFREKQAAQIRQYAALFTPQPPDERLLYTGDPNDAIAYQQQQAAFLRSHAQQQQLQQAADFEQAQAQQIRDEQTQAARTADDERLRTEWPEWFDGTEESVKLQGDLKSLATALYPDVPWDEANSQDILALREVHGWKRDAERWRSYDRNRRNPAGQFKPQRTLPPVNRPGTSTVARQQTSDPVKLLYPND